MRHMYGACGPQGMLEEGWAGVESHWDALPLPSSFRAANQGRLPLLTSMDLAQHMPQVWVDRWGDCMLSHRSKAMGGCVLAG